MEDKETKLPEDLSAHQLQYLNAELERRIRERTAELEAEVQQLQTERTYLQAVLDQMPSGLSIAEAPSGKLLLHNEVATGLIRHLLLESEDYTGYTRHGALHPDGQPYQPEEYPLARSLHGETVEQEEMLYRRGDGSLTTCMVNAAPVHNTEGQIVAAVSTFCDISRRKQAEAELKAALREKETLLKEVYHRVKNNLQGVANLLYLQATYLQDEQARQMFQETRDRVHSIALLHEKLYQSGNLARLDFAEYLNSLTVYLARSYGADARAIRLEVQADPADLDIETAMSLGMIVNELVVNSLKHAFPATWAGPSPKISIELAVSLSELSLTLWDNGVGLPAEIKPDRAESLGLQLVTILAEHMRGGLTVSRENGTRYTLTFTPPA